MLKKLFYFTDFRKLSTHLDFGWLDQITLLKLLQWNRPSPLI